MNPEWQTVPVGRGQLFEGARWLAVPGFFQWVDILAASIHRWRPGAATVESRDLDLEFATVALPIDADRSIVASRDSLHEYDWSKDSLSTLGEWSFDEDIRFNDGGVSPEGSVYVGTMSMAGRHDAGHLFRFADGELSPVLSGIGISNGLDWVAPTQALYIDSLVSRVHRLDFHRSEPEREVFAELHESEEPDGLVVGTDHRVYIASWGGGCIIRLDGDGRRLSDAKLPARFPTSVAIGGKGGNLMLVTSARPADQPALDDSDGMVFFSYV